jgi:hypothetical protein
MVSASSSLPLTPVHVITDVDEASMDIEANKREEKIRIRVVDI